MKEVCYIEREERILFGMFRYNKKIKYSHVWTLTSISKPFNDSTTFRTKFQCKNCGLKEVVEAAPREWLKTIGVPETVLAEENPTIINSIDVTI